MSVPPNLTSSTNANAVVIMKGPSESVTAACLVLASMPSAMQVDTKEKAEQVMNGMEVAYESINRNVDPENGSLEELMGLPFMRSYDESYESVTTKCAYREALYHEGVSLLATTVGNQLERILGLDQMQACSGTEVTKLGFRVIMRVRPTPKTVYAFLRTKWSSGSTENKAELDKTIATDFNASTIDTIKASLSRMLHAFLKREMVCKAPLAGTDQVEKVIDKLDKIGAMKKFVSDFNQKHKEDERTVNKIAAELTEYMRNDRDRITTALRDEEGANSHRAYAADGIASASQSAGRSASSSPGRIERKAGSSSPGQDSSREMRETLRKLRKQLMDKAYEKKAEFCPVCLVENHSLGRCYVAEKARKEAADADSKKDGTGQGSGRNRGGRGRNGS